MGGWLFSSVKFSVFVKASLGKNYRFVANLFFQNFEKGNFEGKLKREKSVGEGVTDSEEMKAKNRELVVIFINSRTHLLSRVL